MIGDQRISSPARHPLDVALSPDRGKHQLAGSDEGGETARGRYQRTGCIPSTLSILLIQAKHRISRRRITERTVHECLVTTIPCRLVVAQFVSVVAASRNV